jgi:hypothetical protein
MARLPVIVLVLTVAGIMALVLVAPLGVLPEWTGLGPYTTPKLPDQEFHPPKTLWDWMQLLIIPIVLAIGGYWLNRSERRNERQIAERRTLEERRIAQDRSQEAAL